MRQSTLFSKTKREAPKDEEAINARLLVRAGFIDKVMAGIYSFLPLGFRVLKKIENIIREEMEAVGGEEIFMPALQPKTNWERTGRWENLNDLFRFKSYYSKIDYALGPTHEEIVAPLLKKFISSYKDLPVYVFQIQNKFRDETRVKSGLLRGREFLMKDLYSFHADEKDLDNYYEKMKKAYKSVFERAGIGRLTYLTFASGGTFSKYSHEFQTLTPAGEDVIYLCEKCRVAVNKEIMHPNSVPSPAASVPIKNRGSSTAVGTIRKRPFEYISSCPECGSRNLKERKAVEVGNIFKLKTKYSTPFNLKYKDKKGEEKDVYMGCYGIGLNRLIGTIVEAFHDDKGIIWPEAVAPFAVHLLKISAKGGSASGGKNQKSPKHSDARSEATGQAKIKNIADRIYHTLQKASITVLYDDRKEVSPGEKFAEADLIGIPWRAVISEKTGDKIEVKKRDENKAKLMSEKELINLLRNTK